jgi:hypothetical protein
VEEAPEQADARHHDLAVLRHDGRVGADAAHEREVGGGPLEGQDAVA